MGLEAHINKEQVSEEYKQAGIVEAVKKEAFEANVNNYYDILMRLEPERIGDLIAKNYQNSDGSWKKNSDIKRSDYGYQLLVQMGLKAIDPNTNIGESRIDAEYGVGTRNAVIAFQNKNGIVPADGDAGPQTLAAMYYAIKKEPIPVTVIDYYKGGEPTGGLTTQKLLTADEKRAVEGKAADDKAAAEKAAKETNIFSAENVVVKTAKQKILEQFKVNNVHPIFQNKTTGQIIFAPTDNNYYHLDDGTRSQDTINYYIYDPKTSAVTQKEYKGFDGMVNRIARTDNMQVEKDDVYRLLAMKHTDVIKLYTTYERIYKDPQYKNFSDKEKKDIVVKQTDWLYNSKIGALDKRDVAERADRIASGAYFKIRGAAVAQKGSENTTLGDFLLFEGLRPTGNWKDFI